MKKTTDLTNFKFDSFTVLSIDKNSGGHGKHYYWFVQCDCGEILRKRSVSIKNKTISCKCKTKYENLSGKIINGAFGSIKILTEDGYDLRYNRKRIKWKYQCLNCKKIKSEVGEVLKRGDISTCGNCKPVGKNHPRHNPNSKFLYKRNGQKHREWSRLIFKRDNFRCVICGSTNKIQAHHLNGWNWDYKNHFNINNGATLCSHKEGCHKKFHKIYGSGNNTIDQFLDFVQNDFQLFAKIHSMKKELL